LLFMAHNSGFSQRVAWAPGRLYVARLAVLALATLTALALVPRAAVAQDEDKAYDQCEDGLRAADAGRWEEAEFRWLKSIAINDQVACGYNNLAVMHERAGDTDEADEYYRQALEHATGAARTDVLDNYSRFQNARISDVVEGVPEAEFGVAEAAGPERNRTLAVTISVPEAEGRELADFERILVGPFIVTTPDAPVPVGPRAVAYFRRRIVQRSFFQAVDIPGGITSRMEDPLKDAAMWKEIAAQSGADLIFTGRIGLETSNENRLVSERIRAPNGEVTEVSRFRNIIKYDIKLHFALLRGDDGTLIQEGDLEGTREFAADDEIPADDMYVETLEELLPQLLDAVTPRRVEQTRVLIY
jgi:phage tail protein X